MSRALSTFEQKVDWMVAHPNVWANWPAAKHTDNEIIQMMKRDGLVAPSADVQHIMDFGKLIAASKSKLRKGK